MNEVGNTIGKVIRIAGPVVRAAGLEHVRLYDVVRVGELGLIGEVIRLSEGSTTIQVYEDTSGIRVGEPVHSTGLPLVVQLGPGLLGQVYDGLQRPLEILAESSGEFVQRGIYASPLPADKRWHFTPRVSVGDMVGPGDILGVVPESQTIEHRVMVPPHQRGRVLRIREGEFTLNETVAVLGTGHEAGGKNIEITLVQRWPVRQPRPCRTRLAPREPLLTGTRIIDAFFPVAKGGSAIIPGGFGTGKTVTEHSLARWADADVVVYVGCGERGNEMTEVLEQFPKLEDPRTGAPLMQRTVLIANTSNMPVAAREASIYTGITIAEYYRDMGYDVLMLADSTSRWGEALREISGRLEEMPGEEGYPAYLAARLAEFYERAGRIICLGNHGDANANAQGRMGSVSVVGAVSPPGGDFSEPVTQNSMRVASTFWALDYALSRRRHFPAINWTNSYSLYNFSDWFEREVATDWNELSREAMALLQREVELLEIVQLVGPDALAEPERAVLAIARMLREDFLQQSAAHEVDRYCPTRKTYWMLKAIMDFYHRTQEALESKIPLERVTALPVVSDIARMKEIPIATAEKEIRTIIDHVQYSFSDLGVMEHA
ncbi:MAG TPA: V-type ATP synthase subunit A [Anaerolineales bacterium]|nr:V-type ATP synthase subunit A [Anaerolineales bacterium]